MPAAMSMPLVQVAFGGAIGSMLRYLSLVMVPAPWGTMGINVLGSFLIGLMFVPAGRMGLSPLLLTGILGGFTTFSAFALDTARLWTAGQAVQAAIYVAGSVILSLIAVAAGAALFHLLARAAS
jgi:fluoride exporter